MSHTQCSSFSLIISSTVSPNPFICLRNWLLVGLFTAIFCKCLATRLGLVVSKRKRKPLLWGTIFPHRFLLFPTSEQQEPLILNPSRSMPLIALASQESRTVKWSDYWLQMDCLICRFPPAEIQSINWKHLKVVVGRTSISSFLCSEVLFCY